MFHITGGYKDHRLTIKPRPCPGREGFDRNYYLIKTQIVKKSFVKTGSV